MELQYEPRAGARDVVVEREGEVMRVVVAMQRLYAPVPKWVGELDLFALVVGPVWWIGSLVVRACLRLPTPARAVFEVSGERVRMTLRSPASGEVSVFDWPRAAVVAVRANRYEAGLWVDVTGIVKNTFLAELSRETIGRIEAALGEGMGIEARH
jgi:hypothetical protein